MKSIIGLKRGTVKLHKHKKQWRESAAETIAMLYEVLGDTACDIQHVGSTSVVHIKAKPVIDIAVAVNSFSDLDGYIPALEARGVKYRPKVNIDNERFFVIGDESDFFTHHIHVVPASSREWINYINFRNYLNAKPFAAGQYEEVKINLLKKYKHNRKAYTDGKAGIIAKLLKEALAWSYLGKDVTVTVLKSLSEKCVPVYSGYIEGVTDDNESQEVYVIGVKKPGCVYTGTVTAIIYGQDNTPGKWVVAPAEASFNQAQIAEVILPFEQDTDVFIDSVHRKSCGVIVYRIVDGNIEYLLVKEYYCYGWSIPKGHMEAGESESDTAIREAWEEVGVRVTPDMEFIRTVEYTIQPVYKKEVVFRISEFKGESRVVKPGIEETGWFVLSEAKKLLKYQETCAVMEDAEVYIAGLHKGGKA